MNDTTSAAPSKPAITVESLEAAFKAAAAFGPALPQIEFYEAFGEVYVVARQGAEMAPLGKMSMAEFGEFKARLRAEGAR